MEWTIYCHTHIGSRRRYIGLTARTMKRRWSQHIVQSRSSKGGRWHFPNAIRKYGPDAFSHEVLEICHSLEVANLAEECWIEFFETRNPKFGFNLAKGGGSKPHGIRKNPWDSNLRAKMSEIIKAALERPEVAANRTAACKKNWQNPNYRFKTILAIKKAMQDPTVLHKISAAVKSSKANKSLGPRICKTHGILESHEFSIYSDGKRVCKKCVAARNNTVEQRHKINKRRRNWSAKRRAEVAAQRRKRYREDSEYRVKVLARNKQQRVGM